MLQAVLGLAQIGTRLIFLFGAKLFMYFKKKFHMNDDFFCVFESKENYGVTLCNLSESNLVLVLLFR